jgi:DEAD/DEAH box helicase domain-containing protein
VTPTASGKTLCYNAPVLHSILENASTRALYLFPTKALAQDQLAELHQMVEIVGEQGGGDIGVFTYDGDTPQDARRAIRGRAHVVLSNPDMVHSGILPHHPRWAKLFENLQFVVIDELHSYRGVFGSHLANILRRLRRVCRHYGSDPRFICSSATIANPKDLAERLTGTAVRARGQKRRTARREVLSLRQSAGRERAARNSPLVSGRNAARGDRVPEARPADDRVSRRAACRRRS